MAGPNAPFVGTGHMHFKSTEEFQTGFFTHASEMTEDIPNFTDIVPEVRIS